MADQNDWRYDSLKEFKGAEFARRRWKMPDPSWDHEHCVGCWQEFAEEGAAPQALQEGYVTEGDNWLCPACFDDFRSILEFRLITPEG